MKRISLAAILFLCLFFAIYERYEMLSKPSISLISVADDSIVSLKDTLVVRMNFYDKNGDVGNTIKSLSKVFVVDMNYNVVQEFPIITVSKANDSPTKGTLKILLDFLPILNSSQQRDTKLKVYITDCAGHKSNELETSLINISKPLIIP